jgi:hypothetical protein
MIIFPLGIAGIPSTPQNDLTVSWRRDAEGADALDDIEGLVPGYPSPGYIIAQSLVRKRFRSGLEYVLGISGLNLSLLLIQMRKPGGWPGSALALLI